MSTGGEKRVRTAPCSQEEIEKFAPVAGYEGRLSWGPEHQHEARYTDFPEIWAPEPEGQWKQPRSPNCKPQQKKGPVRSHDPASSGMERKVVH